MPSNVMPFGTQPVPREAGRRQRHDRVALTVSQKTRGSSVRADWIFPEGFQPRSVFLPRLLQTDPKAVRVSPVTAL